MYIYKEQMRRIEALASLLLQMDFMSGESLHRACSAWEKI